VSCYVDTLRSYPAAGLRFTEFCHLLADERGELHDLAERLGMPRRSFQDHPWRWHYDLPAHVRVEAVRLGAREVDLHFVGRMLHDRRLSVAAGGAADAVADGATADGRTADGRAADGGAADDAAADGRAADGRAFDGAGQP
jgi:uncharacterized protein DUF4031